MKKKVLFVDDEPKVLQGLRRMLHGMRSEWEMGFAESGQEALEAMQNTPYDVLVTDMRMPGMDGSQLLSEVMKRYPNVIRIVLSGQSDQETVMRSVGPAHQYLSKPCDAETLRRTIVRACSLRELLASDPLKRLTSRLTTLPSLPSLYSRLMEELRSQDASLSNVGRIISSDAGMTAKILQLVNSAFFGIARQVTSAQQAVTLLGLETIKALVLSIHIFSQFDRSALPVHLAEGLWRHSVTVGLFARAIVRLERRDQNLSDNSFTAGLLHDIGKLVLAANLADQYRAVLSSVENEGLALTEAEREQFGATHAQVGAYLLGLWGLPDPIVEALAYHHCPSNCQSEELTPLTVVHAANFFENQLAGWHTCGEQQLDEDYFERLKLSDRLNAWKQACLAVAKKGTDDE